MTLIHMHSINVLGVLVSQICLLYAEYDRQDREP